MAPSGGFRSDRPGRRGHGSGSTEGNTLNWSDSALTDELLERRLEEDELDSRIQRLRPPDGCAECAINLSGNALAEGRSLGALLRRFREAEVRVTCLRLHRNHLRDEALGALIEHFREVAESGQPLAELHLSDNHLTEAGIYDLIQAAFRCLERRRGRALWLRAENQRPPIANPKAVLDDLAEAGMSVCLLPSKEFQVPGQGRPEVPVHLHHAFVPKGDQTWNAGVWMKGMGSSVGGTFSASASSSGMVAAAGPKDAREQRDQWEHKEHRDHREQREPREHWDQWVAVAGPKDARDQRDQREHKEHRDHREQREPREHRDQRERREPRESREQREQREQVEQRDWRALPQAAKERGANNGKGRWSPALPQHSASQPSGKGGHDKGSSKPIRSLDGRGPDGRWQLGRHSGLWNGESWEEHDESSTQDKPLERGRWRGREEDCPPGYGPPGQPVPGRERRGSRGHAEQRSGHGMDELVGVAGLCSQPSPWQLGAHQSASSSSGSTWLTRAGENVRSKINACKSLGMLTRSLNPATTADHEWMRIAHLGSHSLSFQCYQRASIFVGTFIEDDGIRELLVSCAGEVGLAAAFRELRLSRLFTASPVHNEQDDNQCASLVAALFGDLLDIPQQGENDIRWNARKSAEWALLDVVFLLGSTRLAGAGLATPQAPSGPSGPRGACS